MEISVNFTDIVSKTLSSGKLIQLFQQCRYPVSSMHLLYFRQYFIYICSLSSKK
ncbi:hypothetical protein [Chryseobacterium elymi]|uniref:hypothetical protein n=1 Tax=Chryseobacterium elymi TaxID=395936 RepID=UPI001EE8962A|nr:hypothetical protein [Chryseobacterium elymi]